MLSVKACKVLASQSKTFDDIPVRVKIQQEQVHSTYQGQNLRNLPILSLSSNKALTVAANKGRLPEAGCGMWKGQW